jgi:8-oxo-dGTP diphosphatase
MKVVAGVLERNGSILIGQRKSTAKHALKWEFPGGKVEVGEAFEDALRRELREELGIDATVGALMDSYTVRYGDGPLTELLFFQVSDFQGEPENRDFEQIVWARREDLRAFDFLEGDLPFLQRLVRPRL